jgi:hypothetical protein
MLELCEKFFEQKHPNPNKDDQEEEEKNLVNDLYVFYKNLKTFIEIFLV